MSSTSFITSFYLVFSVSSINCLTLSSPVNDLLNISEDIVYGRYCTYLKHYFSTTIFYNNFPITVVPLNTKMNSFERIYFIVDYSYAHPHSIHDFSAVVKRHFGSFTFITFLDSILLITAALVFITQFS